MKRVPSVIVPAGKDEEFELELMPDGRVWVSRDQVYIGVLEWDAKRRRLRDGGGVLPESLISLASVSLRVAKLSRRCG